MHVYTAPYLPIAQLPIARSNTFCWRVPSAYINLWRVQDTSHAGDNGSQPCGANQGPDLLNMLILGGGTSV